MKRSFEYYKLLLKELNQPFTEVPYKWTKVLIIYPQTSPYFEALPQTQIVHTDESTFLVFDYNDYDHDKYGEQNTIEEIHKYVISRGGEI